MISERDAKMRTRKRKSIFELVKLLGIDLGSCFDRDLQRKPLRASDNAILLVKGTDDRAMDASE